MLFLALLIFGQIAGASSAIVSINDNKMLSDGKDNIYWNVDPQLENCGIDYGLNSDLSGSIGTNGHIIQVGLPTNDGRFYYVVNLLNLQTNRDYYYKVACNFKHDKTVYQSEIKKLVKYESSISTTNLPDLKITSVLAQPSMYAGKFNLAVYFNKLTHITNFVPYKVKLLDSNTGQTYLAVNANNGNENVDFILPFGSYNFKITIDSDNVIAESNENNNVLVKEAAYYGKDSNDLSALITDIKVSSVSTDNAVIEWTSRDSDISSILYGTENSPNGINKVAKNNSLATKHNLRLQNLLHGTTYYFVILSKSLTSTMKESSVYQFTTLRQNNSIFELEAANISNKSVDLKWKTNGDYDCTVIYSLKDNVLDDDYLSAFRDPEDYIIGSNNYSSASPDNRFLLTSLH